MSIVNFKGREAPKSVRSAMETLLFTRGEVDAWRVPDFQRPIRVNAKVLALVEELKRNGGIIPGILTLGKISGDKTIYIVDGQHRAEAFKISELGECIADVRIVTFESFADMANEFVELNSRLVNMRPDDILRSLAQSMPALQRVTSQCEFVTYGNVRRGAGSTAMVSMSALLRAWHMSEPEIPTQSTPNATVLASSLDTNDADKIIVFMNTARSAWGSDPENYRLWGALNLTITMWLWKRLVIDRARGGAGSGKFGAGYSKVAVLSPEQFQRCLMSVSADKAYTDWLVGRLMNERDRSPCYGRIKAIFTKRLAQELGGGDKKFFLPVPSWASR